MSRYPQRHEARIGADRTSRLPRFLDAEAPTDLTKPLRSRVRVSCILAPGNIIWNQRDDKIVVIMRFAIRAIETPGEKLRNFELDISFNPAPKAGSLPGPSAMGTTTFDPDVTRPSVWLMGIPYQNPLPEYVEGLPSSETQSRGFTVEPSARAGAGGGTLGSVFRTTERLIHRKWTFRSYPISNEHGHPTAAKWVWEANKSNPQVEGRGTLHGAVVLQSAGTDDLMLQCRVDGKLCNGWWWKKFKARDSEPAQWLAKLGPPSDTFEDLLSSLEEKIKDMNTVGLAREQDPTSQIPAP